MMQSVSCAAALRQYIQQTYEAALQTDFQTLAGIAARLADTKRTGATVFTAGNGGSAATASHICNDLVKGCRVLGRTGLRAVCLNDASAVVTCLANDFSYDDIFSLQLETHARRGDLLLVYSGSGNSENILRAVRTARALGMYTVGFTGKSGGALAALADCVLRAPTDCMEQLEDLHLAYEHALVTLLRQLLADVWDVEILRRRCEAKPIRAALFDFDGTVSLIRAGWQEVMIPYFIEVLSAAPQAEDAESVRRVTTEFVDTLTGKQTIFQCMRLAEEVARRGGAPEDPLAYKQEYLRRLRVHIADRIAALEAGAEPERYTVPGAVALLGALRERGIVCYLASGTDEQDVLREAALLGVDGLFDGGVYGARDEILDCSKELVIRRIIERHGLSGTQLAAFGDGYVEIELVHGLGGYAFGVATDEERRCGVNGWKRNRLTAAGADVILPDFSNTERILDLIDCK